MKEYNGYTIRTIYQGMLYYIIEKDGQEVYVGFSVDEIIKLFGFNPNEI